MVEMDESCAEHSTFLQMDPLCITYSHTQILFIESPIQNGK